MTFTSHLLYSIQKKNEMREHDELAQGEESIQRELPRSDIVYVTERNLII